MGIVQYVQAALAIALLAATSIEGRGDTGNLTKVEFDEASLDEIVEFFRTNGGTGGPPRNILVDPKLDRAVKVSLTLHDVSLGVAFAYVAELAGFDYRDEKHALRIFPRRGAEPSASGLLKRGGPMTWRRASEIEMPKVEFDSTELREVIDDIATASRRLDPGKKGLNIVLSQGVDPATPVTLRLQNVPVSTVLKYVAEFARLDLRADGPAIVLMSRPKVGENKVGE